MFPICDICATWGHRSKECPLYRLNEQQTALGAARRRIAAIRANRREVEMKTEAIIRTWSQDTPARLM